MKKKSALLLVMVLGMVVFLSSCATKKKYGCPEHISISNLLSGLK